MTPIISRLQEIARQALRDRPDLTMDILESMQLTASEIAEEGSPEHELELFENHLNELKGNL
jgi:hypothetical protein